MNTLLPFSDYDECAKVLDKLRINSQLNEALVIIKSLVGVYEPKKNGESGWENHTVAKMWRGYELQLARRSVALASEYLLHRSLPEGSEAEALAARRTRLAKWNEMVELMEENEFSDKKPPLIGDEEFHSAFRAFLLYKDIQKVTFEKWKRREYPDHACTRNNLPRKSSWKKEDYERIWTFFGRPDPKWYGQWGWKEEPDDLRVFYSEDRIPQMIKEAQRKRDRPSKYYWVKKNA